MSRALLEKLIFLNADIAGVVTQQDPGMNADYANLLPLCRAYSIPFIFADQCSEDEVIQWVAKIGPQMIFCFGWSYLLKKELLAIPPQGVLGFHPACLPRNRGRHPLIWALALGLKQTCSTFFFMDQGTDNGDLISQEIVPILYEDNAVTLYQKVKETALHQVETFFPQLLNKTVHRRPQELSQASYWRKRSPADGLIDFRMSSTAVYNLVRALARPYPGAHVNFQGKQVKIWQVREIDCTQEGVEPGKVLSSGYRGVDVKCYSRAVRILEHEFEQIPEPGGYIL